MLDNRRVLWYNERALRERDRKIPGKSTKIKIKTYA